jgi:hypothetical protein
MQLLAICDANCCFIYVDIWDVRKNNDSSIYNNSLFNRKLRAGSLGIPERNIFAWEERHENAICFSRG